MTGERRITPPQAHSCLHILKEYGTNNQLSSDIHLTRSSEAGAQFLSTTQSPNHPAQSLAKLISLSDALLIPR